MKVSDVLLDLATGDASKYDAYIQEAVGQVKVSAAIYDAAYQIAALNDKDRESIVQEAAAAGLPSDREQSIDLLYEATSRELIGTVRNFYAEMAMFLESGTSSTSPIAAINSIATKFGVKSRTKMSPDYADEIAEAILKKSGELKDGAKFVKSKKAQSATTNYLNGVCLLANTFGLSTEKVCADPMFSTVNRAPLSTNSKHEDGVADLPAMTATIKNVNTLLSKASIKEADYTTTPTAKDVSMYLACVYAILGMAHEFKIDLKGEDGGSKIEKCIEKKLRKCKDSRACSDEVKELNAKDKETGKKPIVELNESLSKTTKNLLGAFNNSVYSITEALFG